MTTDNESLEQLVDRWLVAADEGLNLAAADLCPNRPELISALDDRLAPLRWLRQAGNSATGPEPTGAGPVLPPDTGRYRFQAFVARGGMGEVWRAFDDDLKRDVAVKVLKAGTGGPADRFRAEAELVARLEHPGVVPIYDAGVLADGRPFFAMKLVRGAADAGPPPTLDELLGRRTCPADDVPRFIQMFQQACEAVAYAHARNPPVLHRDLKPSNIMVGAFGEVLVMDWGIAKVLDGMLAGPSTGDPAAMGADTRSGASSDTDNDRTAAYAAANAVVDTDGSPKTRTGDVKGTIAFMPPEQARGDVRATSPATDVFALGGVLCKILTGRPPHTGNSTEAFERARNGDLSGARGRLERCGADPALIAVALKCLEPEPASRYAGAGELARAVADYRAGIEARLRSAEVERAQAQVAVREERKRRRLMMAAVAIIVLTLAGGAAAAGWQAQRAWKAEGDTAIQLGLTRQAEQNAIAEKNTAVEQEHIATRVREVFQSVLLQSDPSSQSWMGNAPNPKLTVREALDFTIKQIDGKFDGEPFVEAEIRRTLGTAVGNLGNGFQAEAQQRRALELYRQTRGPDDRRTLECQELLGHTLINRTKRLQANETLTDARRRAEEQFGPDDRLVLRIELKIAHNLALSPDTRVRGEVLCLDAVAHHRRALGAGSPVYADAAASVGAYFCRTLQFDRARPLLGEAWTILDGAFGRRHTATNFAQAFLGETLLRTGEPVRGEKLLKEAIEIGREIRGDDDAQTVTMANRLAMWYVSSERSAEAEPLLSQLFEYRRKTGTLADPEGIELAMHLANARIGTGRTDQAVALLQDCLEQLRKLGHPGPGTFDIMAVIGEARFQQGKYDLAEPMLLAAYNGGREHYRDYPLAIYEHNLWVLADKLGKVCELTNRPDEAGRWRKERDKYSKPPDEKSESKK
jgi:eukaryotic-like serine/threonine-protein kinase